MKFLVIALMLLVSVAPAKDFTAEEARQKCAKTARHTDFEMGLRELLSDSLRRIEKAANDGEYSVDLHYSGLTWNTFGKELKKSLVKLGYVIYAESYEPAVDFPYCIKIWWGTD